MTRHMAVQRHLARPSTEIRIERLAQERLCRRNATVAAKEKVHRPSPLADRSIEVMPIASNGNLRLVGAPGSTDGSRESVPAPLIFRHVPGHPSQDCAVGYHDPAFRHHSNEVAIAQPIGDVPANAQLDDFSVEHRAESTNEDQSKSTTAVKSHNTECAASRHDAQNTEKIEVLTVR